jgi:tetratricopeptide (TPR) repeat protein
MLAVERSRESLDLMLANYEGNYSHPRVIEAAQYYANALVHVGDYDSAAAILHDVKAKSESVLGPDSRTVGELSSLSFSAELERGNVRAAVANARRSVAIYLKESKPETPVHAYRARLLGHSLVAARAGNEAVEGLEEALRLSIVADRGRGAATARASYGLALAHVGRFSASETQLRRALDEAPAPSRGKHQAMRHMGTLLRLQGRPAESLEWLDRAIATASLPPMDSFDRNDVAHGLLETGLVRLDLGEFAAAWESFAAAEALFSKSQKQHVSPARADLIVGMARVQMQRRDFASALPSLEKADLFWREFAPDNRWAGETALWLGRCHLALGRIAEAREPMRRAAKLLAASPIPADADLARRAR